MALTITLHGDQPPLPVKDTSQLDQVLSAASGEARTRRILAGILIEAENGNVITMVVGGEETVLGFDHGHSKPPYYASKGKCQEENPKLVCLLNFSHYSEFSRKYAIPLEDGVGAVRQFLHSGELPTCIDWEEV
jgi:hypothetical protein